MADEEQGLTPPALRTETPTLGESDLIYIDAQWKYFKGDPLALADVVRNYNLKAEQREFVAQVIAGEISSLDGRKNKPSSDRLISMFNMLERHPWLLKKQPVSKTEIYEFLAKEFRIDIDSVRRTIARYAKIRKPDTNNK